MLEGVQTRVVEHGGSAGLSCNVLVPSVFSSGAKQRRAACSLMLPQRTPREGEQGGSGGGRQSLFARVSRLCLSIPWDLPRGALGPLHCTVQTPHPSAITMSPVVPMPFVPGGNVPCPLWGTWWTSLPRACYLRVRVHRYPLPAGPGRAIGSGRPLPPPAAGPATLSH